MTTASASFFSTLRRLARRRHGLTRHDACSTLDIGDWEYRHAAKKSAQHSALILPPRRCARAMGAEAADPRHRGLLAGRHRRHRRPHRGRGDPAQHRLHTSSSRTRAAPWASLRSRRSRTAPPDGYTVGIGIMGSLAVAPVVPGSQIPLDLDKDLMPLCNLVGVPMALIVRPTAPYKTIPELIAYAKANPGKVSYGVDRQRLDQPARRGIFRGRSGRAQAAARALSRRRAGHRRRGGGPDRHVLRQHLGNDRPDPRRPGAGAGLAATKPNPMAPDLPLLTKDIPSLDISNWFGLVGPAGLPADIAQRLAKMFIDAIADPATQPHRWTARGLEVHFAGRAEPSAPRS